MNDVIRIKFNKLGMNAKGSKSIICNIIEFIDMLSH